MHGYDTYDIVWRQYYPAIGRFQTPDPEIEDAYAESPYSMCDNNMVNRTDPNGRFWWLAIPIVVGLLMEAEPVNAPTLDYKSNNAAMKQAWSEHNMGVISNFIPRGEEVAVSTRVAVKTFIKQEVKQEVKQEAKKTFQTYIKEAKDKTKDGDYSGRTSGSKSPIENIAKRDANHHMNETHGPAKLDKSSPNPNAIRGREQQNINKRGGAKSQGGTSGNKINGVSPNNKNAKIYEQAAKKEFGK